MKVEELKCFKFESSETDYIIAECKNDAIAHYESIIGVEMPEFEVEEIKEWHSKTVNVRDGFKWIEKTFLEVAKEDFTGSLFEPYIISSTAY